jgi:hypothetical protein
MSQQLPMVANSAVDFPICTMQGVKLLPWYYVSGEALGGFPAAALASLLCPSALAKYGETSSSPGLNIAQRIFGGAVVRMPLVSVDNRASTQGLAVTKRRSVCVATLDHLRYLLDNPPKDCDLHALRGLRAMVNADSIRAAFSPIESAVKAALEPTPREEKTKQVEKPVQQTIMLQAPPISLSAIKPPPPLVEKPQEALPDLAALQAKIAAEFEQRLRQELSALQAATLATAVNSKPTATPIETYTTYQITRRYLQEKNDPILYKMLADLLYRAADAESMSANNGYQTTHTKNGTPVRLFDEQAARRLVARVLRMIDAISSAIRSKEIGA